MQSIRTRVLRLAKLIWNRRYAVILPALLLTIHPEMTGQAQPVVDEKGVSRMKAVTNSFEHDGLFTGTVLVARNGTPVLNQSFGYADAEWQVPITSDTRFRIGSITKQFTAAAIVMLQERGKLSLQDSILKYLPALPISWSHITIQHLLTHTSGLASITSLPDYASLRTVHSTPEQLIALFKDKPLEYEPGTKYSYGNSDYIVLGLLIEKISGQSYAAFLEKNIFSPLHMTETGVDDELAIIPRRAQGYVLKTNGIRHADSISMTVPFSAGNLYSTTGDLLKWEAALFAGRVVSPESLKLMLTPFRNGYGLGLSIGKFDEHLVISHTGDIDGFGAMLAYYPDDKLTVIVLSNLFGGAYGLIAKDLAKAAFGLQFVLPSERKAVSVPTKILAEYVGTYQLTPNIRNVIAMSNGRLTSKIGNQAELEMVPESETMFFFRSGESEIEFIRDPANHKVSRLIVHQDGASFEGTKVDH